MQLGLELPELAVTSHLGEGSVFSFTIPAGVCATRQTFPDELKTDGHTGDGKDNAEQPRFSGNVLVAEDAKTNQVLVKLLLERMGLKVTIAKEGSEAVQKALAGTFELILMDIQMPGMNGYEAARILREKGIATPIIALTANAMKGDDKKCIAAGCDDYLPKPIDRHKLIEKVSKYLPAEEPASVCSQD